MFEIVCENKCNSFDSLMPCAFRVAYADFHLCVCVYVCILMYDGSEGTLRVSFSSTHLLSSFAWIRLSYVNLFNIPHLHLPPTWKSVSACICEIVISAQPYGCWKSHARFHYKMLGIFTYAPFTLKRFNILQNHLVFECEVTLALSLFQSIFLSLPLSKCYLFFPFPSFSFFVDFYRA